MKYSQTTGTGISKWKLAALSCVCVMMIVFACSLMNRASRDMPGPGNMSEDGAHPSLRRHQASGGDRLLSFGEAKELDLGSPLKRYPSHGVHITLESAGVINERIFFYKHYGECFSLDTRYHMVVKADGPLGSNTFDILNYTDEDCKTFVNYGYVATNYLVGIPDNNGGFNLFGFKDSAIPYYITWTVADDENFTSGLRNYVGYTNVCEHKSHLNQSLHGMFTIENETNIVAGAYEQSNCSGSPSVTHVAKYDTVGRDGNKYYKAVGVDMLDTPRILLWSDVYNFDTSRKPHLAGTVEYNKCQYVNSELNYVWVYPVKNSNQMVGFYWDVPCDGGHARTEYQTAIEIPYSEHGTKVNLYRTRNVFDISTRTYVLSIYSYNIV